MLARIVKHPDQFLNFYLNVVDEVLNADNAAEWAEERSAAVRRLGIGSMEVKTDQPNKELIRDHDGSVAAAWS